MAHTYTALYYHVIFSTKNREPWISADIEKRVWSYLGAVAINHNMRALCVGGVDDHLHVMLSAPPTLSVSNAVKLIKGATSRWIHQTFPEMAGFAWQTGYATLTLGRTQLKDAERYILRQRQHHAHMSFEEELAIFLRRNGIKVDS
jgi:putative transposase